MEKVLFSEEQRFNQWWIKFIAMASLLAVLIPILVRIYTQVMGSNPLGDTETSLEGLVVSGIVSVVVIVFMFIVIFASQLKTKITTEALFVIYSPFKRNWQKFTPEQISRYEIRTYRAKREYGGHGIKTRRRYGSAYTISGNVGMQLYLKNGKKLLIGTQKKQAFEYAMRKLMEGEE
ncbi:hypothetical protein [Maribellus sediminis]|uniref:hypothetical protein n=1 Tax=Maribellus sediminis TaxID=2696285 RepID=UPI0014304E6D|nr:hypothetical protein [Maribellus sediminis]